MTNFDRTSLRGHEAVAKAVKEFRRLGSLRFETSELMYKLIKSALIRASLSMSIVTFNMATATAATTNIEEDNSDCFGNDNNNDTLVIKFKLKPNSTLSLELLLS